MGTCGEEGHRYIFNLLSEDDALLLRSFLRLKADFSSNPTWSEENNQSDEQNPSIQCDAVKLRRFDGGKWQIFPNRCVISVAPVILM